VIEPPVPADAVTPYEISANVAAIVWSFCTLVKV
jgi:hypothetical protein